MTQNFDINENELIFTASRASGPGGQHVNKTSSKIALRFYPASSASLSDGQKKLIISRLASRIDASGAITVTSQTSRSQLENKRLARERLLNLLGAALKPVKKRRKTSPTAASRKRRLEEKRKHGEIKKFRSSKPSLQ